LQGIEKNVIKQINMWICNKTKIELFREWILFKAFYVNYFEIEKMKQKRPKRISEHKNNKT